METVPLNSPRLLIRPQMCRKSGNCAFKQPETLDTALDSLWNTHRNISTENTERIAISDLRESDIIPGLKRRSCL